MSTILGVHVYTRRPDLGWNVSMLEMKALEVETCEKFGITAKELIQPDNHQSKVQARRWFAIKAREAGYSLPVIGAYLCRHHATIFHLVKGMKAGPIRRGESK